MKFIHLSDLHLGKRVNEFSMLEDQEYILKQILGIIVEESPDAVLIAGDVYDKPVPPAEAVRLFDDFLVRLASREMPVFIISGNHDSADRIAFGSRLMDGSGIHFSPVYDGTMKPFTLRDALGEVRVYMLPFLKPAYVRSVFTDETEGIASYTDAVRTALAHADTDPACRNVLVTHQFVTGGETCDSEDISVGGTDNVDAEVFSAFDYVALGHLHGPQNVGRGSVRYCGTPLKYSFSEVKHEKSVTVAELGAKGEVTVRVVPLIPKRDMREERGTYEELVRRGSRDARARTDWFRLILTDEQDVLDAAARLRTVYPGMMKLEYDNTRTRREISLDGAAEPERRSPEELFADFYEQQNGMPLSGAQREFCATLFEQLKEEEQ